MKEYHVERKRNLAQTTKKFYLQKFYHKILSHV